MRRGHPGFGGWRNENPRHFRPRNSGNPHFRPPRNFNSINLPRFPPSGPRLQRPPYNHRFESEDRVDHDRNRYRSDTSCYPFSRANDKIPNRNERQMLPFLAPNVKHGNTVKTNTHSSDLYHVNSMGDVDQRLTPHKSGYKIHPGPQWNIDNQFQDVDDRAYRRPYKHDSIDQNKSQSDYVGHRPPSSDHYGGNLTSTIENCKTFTRSVDDTVNIVRKRLLSKSEIQNTSDCRNVDRNVIDNTNTTEATSSYNEQSKKKMPRQRQNIQVNCDKIKNKIVHQLFKMDKKKIHKLLDNPNSSTKFEYAINSLLTESQNSFNQHLRSVAEKSLCSSSTEFIQNDNNTIYEDTFMKQMQYILDPQDTVLLEDIKPVVMAELSKVLELDEFEHRFDNIERPSNILVTYQGSESDYFDEYPQDKHRFNDVPEGNTYDSNIPENNEYNFMDHPGENYSNKHPGKQNMSKNQKENFEESSLYERRPRRKSCMFPDTSNTSETRKLRKSLDSRLTDYFPRKEKFLPDEQSPAVFDANAPLLDEEDTFAELDKQYHVAVDHDLIENDELLDPDSNYSKKQPSEPFIKQEKEYIQPIRSVSVGPFNSQNNLVSNKISIKSENHVEQETKQKEDTTQQNVYKGQEIETENKNNNDIENSKNMTLHKTSTSSNSRKRSIDQRPSHRKEKRKKVNEEVVTTNKELDEIRNLHDNDLLKDKKDQSSTSASNIFSKEEEKTPPSEERRGSSDKSYSNKYVKRKENNVRNDNSRKRQISTSSNHSISPKNNDTLSNVQTSLNSDSKAALKTINMFIEQPKKVNIHQAFRNTAQQINVGPKKIAEIKPKPTSSINLKCVKKYDTGTLLGKILKTKETQTLKPRLTSKFTQTATRKYATQAVQTDLIPSPKKSSGSTSTDAFERMKEIDLEIQVLLQEKFKLYNSLESKEVAVPMQTLGMTVLNVASFDENRESNDTELEDDVVNNFTNIPEEELEQLAVATGQGGQNQASVSSRRNQRRKELQVRPESESPISLSKGSRKAKTPNISLIERIISDDRPLEDIISLYDLEVTPVKSKQKAKQRPKKKAASKRKPKALTTNIQLKECYVCLIQEDLSRYLTCNKLQQSTNKIDTDLERDKQHSIRQVIDTKIIAEEESIIEETIVNDLQFDMLDVSLDIVIGDNYEDKCADEKEAIQHAHIPISEEIILDNSQSSIDDVDTPAENHGGECKLYDFSSDENLQRDSLIVSGNADAILAIECVEQNFLAAGLDGNVYHFNSDGQLLTTMRGSNLAVTCLTIVKEKYGTTVYTGSLDSRIRYYDLETGLEKGPECNVLSPIQTMDRAWDTVFVGTRTGFVLQFECKNNMLIPVSTVKFSEQSILSLRAMKEGPRKVLLVAARSENVTIKDAQTGLLLRTLCGPKMTVYTLLYEDGKVYCGTSSHQIHVFEYTTGGHVGTHEGGKGAVCLRATGGFVFAGCYDGCVYVYREGEPRPLAQLRGPSPMLLSLAVVGSKIIAGFKDRSLYIWKIPLCILQEMIL